MIVLSLLICIAGRAFAVETRTCTTKDSIEAEEQDSNLKNWDGMYKSYKRFKQCDDGAVAELYSDAIAKLLTEDWKSIGELDRLISKDKNFGVFVIHHVDELMTFDQAQKMYENVRSRCPETVKKLCKRIEVRLNETPTGTEEGKPEQVPSSR